MAELLSQQGLQSPVKIADKKLRDRGSRNRKLEVIGYHFSKIMEALELDLEDLGVRETPERVAWLYVDELFKGLEQEEFPKCTTFPIEESTVVL